MVERTGAVKGGLTLRERIQRVVDSLRAYSQRPKGYLARTEFWVYLDGGELPTQERIMDRMLESNPYRRRGFQPIGVAERVFFSDVRVSWSLVLKEKNPRIFRSSVFPEALGMEDALLARIMGARSLAKLSVISEQPFVDLAHVGFLTHAAAAVAELGEGAAVYDLMAEKIWSSEGFGKALKVDPEGKSADFHLKTSWIAESEGGHVETRGLRKIGLPDFRTARMERDERVLVCSVVELAAEACWNQNGIEPKTMVSLFDDRFIVETGKQANGFAGVTLLREQTP